MHRHESVNDDPWAIDADLAARLFVLRREHPEMQVSTELLRVDDRAIVVRAAIALPSGATASGIASAPPDRVEAYEFAESRAVARALLFLGLGAPARGRGEAVAREEMPSAAPERRETRSPAPEARAVERTVMPEPERPAPGSRAREAEQAEAIQTPTPARQLPPPAEPPAPASDADPAMEDISWTAFWNWARKVGYQKKEAVEAVIGQPITSLNPAQVRQLLREKAGLGDQ